jgi:hypothetical protein
MLTLQQILESDSISTLIVKLNTNFQSIALSGGGPAGIPGEQGIPGLPGRQGALGPTGSQGPTGTVVGIIPFGSTAGGDTGPTGDAGPWNAYSYQYLNQVVGTGPNKVGQIWIDHWNQGFWEYLNAPDGTSTYTNSPYSNPQAGTVPPGSTGYYGGTGWYFYPLNVQQSAGSSDVWVSDVSTYLIGPTGGGAWETGPYSSPSPLTVKNARLLSKYGTVWISSGNAINGSGVDDQSNLDTDTIYNQGYNTPANLPQPARYNAGLDRIFFKQSIDTLPFTSNVTARAWSFASGGLGDPGEESNSYPIQNGNLLDSYYWVKPLYSPSLNEYSPLQYYTERRDDSLDYPEDTIFGSLGLYQYSALPTYFTNTKSLFVYSTRSAITPEDNTSGNVINNSNTFNIGEMVFDVKRLIASNQFICSTPQDLYGSSDFIQSGLFNEANGIVPYTVTQGFLSSVNGKQLTGDPIYTDLLDYGNLTANPAAGTTASGNYTRSIWYGSAATVEPTAWYDQYDSEDANLDGNDTLPNFIDKTYRIAGMKERGKKTWNNSDDTYFLSELVFYSSQFMLNNNNHEAVSTQVGFDTNGHNSRPGFYLSPYRNFGIGTFATDDSGVLEPAARLHVNAFIRNNDYEGITSSINPNLLNVSGNNINSPRSTWRAGAFTAELNNLGSTATSVDLYIGGSKGVNRETANPLLSGKPYTPSENYLDVAIRRETWSPAANYFSTILRLGVKSKTSSTSSESAVGIDAALVPNEFPLSLVPLVSATGATPNTVSTPVGVGIHNIFPRSRAHFFGKNLTNEAYTGNEPYSPGFAVLAGQSPTGTYPFYTPSLNSRNQVIIDYIGNGYGYPTSIFEYPYEVFSLPNGTVSPDAVGGYSPNAANFPWRDVVAPTRTSTPWGLTGRNYGYPATTGSVNGAYRHGATYGDEGNIFPASQYIGFNLFRDLLNTGDNADTTRWRLGSGGNGYGNGGAAIISSEDGDLAFINIPHGRDGGAEYMEWEQQGLTTRDVLNNISLVISKKGDLGLGNRPGYDPNAYSSLERNLSSGNINYVRTTSKWNIATGTGDARVSGPVQDGSFGLGTGNNKPYGFVDYTGLSATYVEVTGTSSAAKINSLATQGEYVRFEVGAEKFYGKNSRSSLKAGYGYPPNTSKTISGSDIENYLLLDWAAYTTDATTAGEGIIEDLTLYFDFEGRIKEIAFDSTMDPILDPTPYYYGFVLPHPTEFNSNSGTPWQTTGFTAPPGSHAAGPVYHISFWSADWVGNPPPVVVYDYAIFDTEEIGKANLRLNNFVAGEGMNVSTAAGQTAAAAAVKVARQTSPKLILSFLEADSTVIPGLAATNVTPMSRPQSGANAYRKVNTIIGSKQNESSAREYWIPKADNTGGTFMVFTDHYGNKTDSLDETTVQTSRFYVEEVVTLEFVNGYTGATGARGITGTAGLSFGKMNNNNSTSQAIAEYAAPMYVKYFNSQTKYPDVGLTGNTAGNFFNTNEYAKIIRPLNTYGITGAAESYNTKNSAGVIQSNTFDSQTTNYPGAPILRNADKYYNIWSDTTNWDNGWNNPSSGINNQSSAFRFKRINQDMALVDFNLTIEANNPDVSNGVEILNSTTANRAVDNGSPRWTQYIRLAYLPTKDINNDRNLFMKRFGNSLSFMNWSSFNQWYPGTAVTSDPSIGGLGGDALTKTGLSQFTQQFGYNSGHANNITWNGNFVDAVAGVAVAQFYPSGSVLGLYAQIYAPAEAGVTGTWPGDYSVGDGPLSQTNLVPRHAFAFYNAALSASLLAPNGAGTNTSTFFGFFMGRAYSILGNDYLSRQRSCMWRLTPRVGNYHGVSGTSVGADEYKNNSFALEVQFDKPILHISTPFADWNFKASSNGSEVKPYRYLTVNGQAMVRYSDKTQTIYDPTVSTQDPNQNPGQ